MCVLLYGYMIPVYADNNLRIIHIHYMHLGALRDKARVLSTESYYQTWD